MAETEILQDYLQTVDEWMADVSLTTGMRFFLYIYKSISVHTYTYTISIYTL